MSVTGGPDAAGLQLRALPPLLAEDAALCARGHGTTADVATTPSIGVRRSRRDQNGARLDDYPDRVGVFKH